MSEVREKRQYMIIHHAISVLTTLCCGDVNTTVDLLTGYLWDEEEAGHIKQALAELDAVQEARSEPEPGFEICEFCGCQNNKLCMRTCCDRGRKADELAGKNKCRHCGASRVTRPSGEWQFACKCDDPEKRPTKPEPYTGIRLAEGKPRMKHIPGCNWLPGSCGCGADELNAYVDKIESEPEPGEFTKGFRHILSLSLSTNRLGRIKKKGLEACKHIDRQAKQLRDKHTISKEGTEDGR